MDDLPGFDWFEAGPMILDSPPVQQPTELELSYHRLSHGHTGTARWWRPFSTFGVAAGLYVAMMVAVLILSVLAAFIVPAAWAPSEMLEDPRNPTDMLIALGTIALMLPAVVLGARWGGGLRGAIHSVAGRVRWRMLFHAAAIVLPLYAAVHAISFLVSPPEDFAWPSADLRTAAVFVIILLLAPLQCAGEEYAFRGLPQQMLGTWLRSPVWGILLPVPLFMIGHGYDWVGQIQIAVFAICMGILVWKSGGLELAIVVHTANNLTLFLLAPFSASSLEQGTVSPLVLLIGVPMTLGVSAGLFWWVSRAQGLGWLEPVRQGRVVR
ncbi:CPBP family intramembrane metalloprotease [Nesterenkonia sp. E16_7]|uniref:CPBP family intramembrane glutamic endopeptidase n=1 Tax=unclassified Nesterenkonia TaxID=2629769 RepID=UPI001A927DD9|nr:MULTISPECIES: type II CAAX endopeptidase family protein [unclassified Nesterenkonia]MBO0594604.1 CPBP family intramembrane metalloprotease [Nesterenkonia sp. E16_10]MBO0599797.1 CPBP family intramembrane metalloprotease [Nesterenkonia sp. E16_7]